MFIGMCKLLEFSFSWKISNIVKILGRFERKLERIGVRISFELITLKKGEGIILS